MRHCSKSTATLSIIAAIIVLLIPALALRHPFLFWDTVTFYAWGHDILGALRQPWPPLTEFPTDRGLWAASGFTGAWQRISPDAFQLTLSIMGARSEFYAAVLYVIGSTLTLWAPAIAQAALTAYVLWVSVGAVLSPRSPTAYLLLLFGLTALTSAPFEAAFLMPDFFTGLGLVAAALLVFYRDRLLTHQRVALALVVLAATVVHTSNFAVLAAFLGIAFVVARLIRLSASPGPGLALVAGVVAVGLGAVELSRASLKMIFGQEVRTAPFLEGRIIADGAGQLYLRDVCDRQPYVACRFKDMPQPEVDNIIWVGSVGVSAPLVNDPEERRRFLAEEPAVILGAITHYPLTELLAATRNAALQLVRFQVTPPMGYPLSGLLREGSDRSMWAAAITPGLAWCMAELCDHRGSLRYVGWAHDLALAAAGTALLLRLLAFARAPEAAGEDHRRLVALALVLGLGVLANDVICGVLAGPFPRYGARVVWLVPLAAALFELHVRPFLLESAWPRRRTWASTGAKGPPLGNCSAISLPRLRELLTDQGVFRPGIVTSTKANSKRHPIGATFRFGRRPLATRLSGLPTIFAIDPSSLISPAADIDEFGCFNVGVNAP